MPVRSARMSTTCFCPKGVRTSSSAIAANCLPSASRTSTARTTRQSSMNGLSRGCRRRWRMPVPRARSWSISRNSRFRTRSVANLHRISRAKSDGRYDCHQREIFGPILPIKTYADRQEVADYINSHDRPLAIYPFTHNAELRDFYISRVMSGGVSVNEALLHVGQHDLPFGGVGASGMGHYHAREGFNTFSKLRPVFYQGPLSPIQLLFQPPYGARSMRALNLLIRLKT